MARKLSGSTSSSGLGNLRASIPNRKKFFDAARRAENVGDRDFTDPVNMGSPDESSMRELAERVRRLSESRARIIHRALPPDDPKVRRPPIDRARSALGRQPQVALDEELTQTIATFRALLNA